MTEESDLFEKLEITEGKLRMARDELSALDRTRREIETALNERVHGVRLGSLVETRGKIYKVVVGPSYFTPNSVPSVTAVVQRKNGSFGTRFFQLWRGNYKVVGHSE